MDETALAPLAEIIDSGRKITYGIVQPGERQPEGEGVPLIRGQDYSSGTVHTRDLYWVLPEISAPYSRSLVRPGDLLISIVGYVGTIAEVPAELDGANLTQTTARLAVGSNADSRFLLHALRGPEFQAEVRRYMKGSAQPGLNLSDVERMRVRLPPLQEQRRIAEILDTIDETIQATERVIAKMSRTVRGLLRTELHRLGGRPKALGELSRFTNGFSFRSDEWTDRGYPIIRIQNLNGSTEYNFFSGGTQPDWHVRPGDLLFAWSGMRETSFGPALWEGPEGVLNQHIFKLDVDEALIAKHFLYMLLEDQKLKIADLAHGFKDSFVHVTRSELTGYRVRVPDLEDQRRLVFASQASSSRLEAETSTLEKLRRLRAGLADDLLSGRVRTVAA